MIILLQMKKDKSFVLFAILFAILYSNENTISLEFINFVSRQKTLAFRYEK